MDHMPITQWAKDLQQDVFKKWENELPNAQEGFKIFGGPVQKNPKILFAGTNPGSSSDVELPREHMERFQKGNFDLPNHHDFLDAEWDLATEFRENLFLGNENHIKQTVATNRFFLHTSEEGDLNESNLDTFNEFCQKKFLEIVERLSPELVLCFSQKAYYHLENEYKFEKVKSESREDPVPWSKDLLWVSDSNSPRVIWIVHPSGKRLPDIEESEWKTIRDEVYSRVDFN